MESTVGRGRAQAGSDEACLVAKNGPEPHRLSMANEDYLEAKDHENNITYNISTVDNASALMEIYQLQGAKNPEKRNILFIFIYLFQKSI